MYELESPKRPMSGPEKAAVVLVQMGRERAAALLKLLPEAEVEALMGEVARLEGVDGVAANEVLTEFRDLIVARNYVAAGGIDLARELLEGSVGADKAKEILERLNVAVQELPFEFLRRADPRQVLGFLQEEHPQTMALVLSYMYPEQVASVMGGLPEELQADVAHRIAVMDSTSPDVIRQVEQVLQRKLSTVLQSSQFAAAGGVQSLVDILNRADRGTERLILDGLERQDPELTEEVRSRMFVFEDIVTLDNRAVQLVLRDVATKDLAVALKGSGANVRDKILRNMSERAAATLDDEISVLGPTRLKAVEESQSAIVRVIRNLEETGAIVLSRGNDELVV